MSGRRRLGGIAIFLGSALAFWVEPMVARTILPVFGGASSVWVTSMVVFQALMLAGYGYACWPASGRRAGAVHIGLLLVGAAAAAWLPWLRPALFAAVAGLPPTVGVVCSVTAAAGFAFLLLGANSTVVQSWVGGGREAYRLYSVGNLGSFAGLVGYPLVVEPLVAIRWQWCGFAAGMAGYAVLLWLVRGRGEQGGVGRSDGDVASPADGGEGKLAWVVLPMVSSALLTAVTARLTTDFSPLPLLWCGLLGAFLLSYVIGFSRFGDRWLAGWTVAAGAVFPLAGWATFCGAESSLVKFAVNLAAGLALLLVVGTALHSWLCWLRPGEEGLKRFYLCVAAGGAIGGLLAGVGAPLAFDSVAEFPLSVAAAGAALVWLVARHHRRADTVVLNRVYAAAVAAGCIAVVAGLVKSGAEGGRLLWARRGFYGIVSVRETHAAMTDGTRLKKHTMFNGATSHGMQVCEEGYSRKPTMYYSLNGGGAVVIGHPKRVRGEALRVGLIGMGAGTMAALGEKGDVFRFYEINPECVAAATDRGLFTFIADSAARVEIVAGDARLRLAEDVAAGRAGYDLLVVDAYAGDSVPLHLVTAEAFRLYRAALAPGGVIAAHLSNWHVDLWPVMKAAAREIGMTPTGSVSGPVWGEFAETTLWAFMAEREFRPKLPSCCKEVDWELVADRRLPTDERGSLLSELAVDTYPPVVGGYDDEGDEAGR